MRTIELDNLPQDLHIDLYEIMNNEAIHEYHNILKTISQENFKNPRFWLSNFAARNTLVSPFLLNLSRLFLIKRVIEKENDIECIIVSERYIYKAVKEYLRKNKSSIRVIYRPKKKAGFKKLPFFNQLYFCKMIFDILKLLFQGKKTGKKKNLNLPDDLILLDIYLSNRNIENNNLHDRYYTNVTSYISDEDKSRIYYLPSYYSIIDNKKFFQSLRNVKENVLIKEDFLNLGDVLSSVYQTLKMGSIKNPVKYVNGFNVLPLIKSELKNAVYSYGSLEGFLDIRFIKRLSEKKVTVERVINWFENQIIDKAMNYGFRKYYPQTDIVGYSLGFAPSLYLCYRPTEVEEKNEVVPKRFVVFGKKLVNNFKKFNQSLDVSVAPNFRMHNIWDLVYNTKDDRRNILISLSYLMTENLYLFNCIKNIITKSKYSDYNFLVKPHPAADLRVIKNAFKEIENSVKYITGNFSEIVNTCSLVIGGPSGSNIETMAMGVPIIVIQNYGGLVIDYIPEDLTYDIFRKCSSEKCVEKEMDYFLNNMKNNQVHYKKLGEMIKDDYFEPVTTQSVRDFLKV